LRDTEEVMTQDQADELAAVFRPLLREVVGAQPGQEFDLKITCSKAQDGLVAMRWEGFIDGEMLTPVQEQRAKFTLVSMLELLQPGRA